MSKKPSTAVAFNELRFSDDLGQHLTRATALAGCLKDAAHHSDEPELAEVAYAAYECLEEAHTLLREWDEKSRSPRAHAATEAQQAARIEAKDETPIDPATLARLETLIKNERRKAKKQVAGRGRK